VTIFTLSIPLLQNEWKVSTELTSLQASFVFVISLYLFKIF